TVHIGAEFIGATLGDDIFGVGGYLHYTGINGTITLSNGSGADTVFVAPSATTPFSITGGNPTAAPGDRINLALAAAQNYVLNGSAASGSVTSSNLKTVNYSGFETGPAVDNVAPAVVNADINLNGAAPVPPGANVS